MGVNPKRGVGPSTRPLLKSEIEVAQLSTKSGAEAARFLHVDYKTYRRYAEMYGIFEQHRNTTGRGVRRDKIKGKLGLEAIITGNNPTYPRRKLKERLIRAGYLKEECALCGYDRRRVLDGKVALILHSIDGNDTNNLLENLQLRCYNCTFETSGKISERYMLTYEPTTPLMNPGVYEQDQIDAGGLTDEEIEALRKELEDDEE